MELPQCTTPNRAPLEDCWAGLLLCELVPAWMVGAKRLSRQLGGVDATSSTIHQSSSAPFSLTINLTETAGNTAMNYTMVFNKTSLLIDGDPAWSDPLLFDQLAPTLEAMLSPSWMPARSTCGTESTFEKKSRVFGTYEVTICRNATTNPASFRLTLQAVPVANASWANASSDSGPDGNRSHLVRFRPAPIVPSTLLALDGRGSFDREGGYITSWRWQEGSRAAPATTAMPAILEHATAVSSIVINSSTPLGTHGYRLVVTDDVLDESHDDPNGELTIELIECPEGFWSVDGGLSCEQAVAPSPPPPLAPPPSSPPSPLLHHRRPHRRPFLRPHGLRLATLNSALPPPSDPPPPHDCHLRHAPRHPLHLGPICHRRRLR